MRVSVVGYGAMGSGIAKRLHLQGHSVNCYDVFTQRIADFRAFKAEHPNPHNGSDVHSMNTEVSLGGVLQHSDVIVICVVNEAQCESVLETLLPGLGATTSSSSSSSGAGAGAVEGSIVSVLVTSTVAPDYIAALPGRVDSVQANRPITPGAKNYRIVDAPISGGVVRAELGSLIVMAAGPPADIDRARPVLQSMSDYVPPGETSAPGAYYVCGDKCGEGMMVKICHQLIAGSNLASAAEGYALARACGVFGDAFVDICTRGAASSFMLQNRGARIKQSLVGEAPPCMSR
jgi:putative dehydrogenase